MDTDANKFQPSENFRVLLAMQREFEVQESTFCTKDNIEESLSILSEELSCFGIVPPVEDDNEIQTEISDSLTNKLINLINASWQLIHKHRELINTHSQRDDIYCKTSFDNVNLKNHIKRLKEDLEKKQNTLCDLQERERRLKVQYDSTMRDLKVQKDEVLKLKKQAQSKDNQHAHELRRITQSDHKLREQLQKSIGTYVPKDKVLQNLQAEHEKEILRHKKTIGRLEENNRAMLQEINDLREALERLSVQSGKVDLHFSFPSGISGDVET